MIKAGSVLADHERIRVRRIKQGGTAGKMTCPCKEHARTGFLFEKPLRENNGEVAESDGEE